MGTFKSIGKVLTKELEKYQFCDVKQITELSDQNEKFVHFLEAAKEVKFWNQLGMKKSIPNYIEPHIAPMKVDEQLLVKMKREIERASLFDLKVYAAEQDIHAELNGTKEKLNNYRTFDVKIASALLFCPSLLEFVVQNFSDTDLEIKADSTTVEIGHQPLGPHNAFNNIVVDNFYGITEMASPINYHLNLNTGSNYEKQSPFVLWKGMDKAVITPRYSVKYLLDGNFVKAENKDVLLKNLFVAENFWEPVTDMTLSKSATLEIIDPLYLKARYCESDIENQPEGFYAITDPNEALVFSSAVPHASNYFPPATEKRITAIIRTTQRKYTEDFQWSLNGWPGSSNSGVDIEKRAELQDDKRKRMGRVYGMFFGYGDVEVGLASIKMWDKKTIEDLQDHYNKAESFFSQDQFNLSSKAKEAMREFFLYEKKLRDGIANNFV